MIDNKNILYLQMIVNKDDEFGNKYIDLITSALKDSRGCIAKYKAAKNKSHKEKFFSRIGKPYTYCEIHHIIPKCCGGSDEPENLVYLYCTEEYPEHVQAHEYLWRSTSLFIGKSNQLAASFFKMTFSRNLKSRISNEDAARLRQEYGNWKSVTNSGKRKTGGIDILYNGKIYSSLELSKISIDGSLHDRHTILDWARYGEHGLSLASGERIARRPKKVSHSGGIEIWSSYDNTLYTSARSLVGVVLEDGKIFKSRSGIIEAALNEKYGLKIINTGTKFKASKYLLANRQKADKTKKLTREQRALFSPKSIQIEYGDTIYPSARSMESIIFPDGKCHSKQTIISWARKSRYGLKIIDK